VIILRSDGVLFEFPFTDKSLEEIISTKKWTGGLVPKGEYEGLCADESNGMVYVLCKQCESDKPGEATTAYMLRVQPGGSIMPKGSISIDVQAIEELSGKKKLKFFPSALAKNPQTQEWYILSSANKMLVIADNTWRVKEVYPLDPAHFRQPEGIAFDGDNNLYISNEGDAISNGNVLKFVFKKSN
jgi:DNA-binding beta-propeller fold protein YncE